MKRAALLWAVFVLIPAISLAQEKIVTLKSGYVYIGRVTPTKDRTGYEITTSSGAKITVKAQDVRSIEDRVTPADEFNRRLSQIDPKSASDRYDLARWAVRNDLLEQARLQLQEALKIDPNYLEAALLLRQVQAQIRATSRPSRPARQRPTTDRVTGPSGPKVPQAELLLGQDDIYRIRLEELRPTDQVSIRFENDVLERFISMMEGRYEFQEAGFENTFRSWDNVRKTIYILDNLGSGGASIKDDIRIQSDPSVMVTFRSRIWPMVAQYCASSQCHGAPDKAVGGLKLFNIGVRSDAVDYTNFLILDAYSRGGWRMINRNDPELSLLVQYGLPPEQARRKHPIKITSMLTKRNSVNYRRLVEWIGSLKPLHPDYRIQWKPPFGMKLNLRGRTLLPPIIRKKPAPEDQNPNPTNEP